MDSYLWLFTIKVTHEVHQLPATNEKFLHGEELWHKIPQTINLTVCKLLYETYLPQGLPDIVMGRQK